MIASVILAGQIIAASPSGDPLEFERCRGWREAQIFYWSRTTSVKRMLEEQRVQSPDAQVLQQLMLAVLDHELAIDQPCPGTKR